MVSVFQKIRQPVERLVLEVEAKRCVDTNKLSRRSSFFSALENLLVSSNGEIIIN